MFPISNDNIYAIQSGSRITRIKYRFNARSRIKARTSKLENEI